MKRLIIFPLSVSLIFFIQLAGWGQDIPTSSEQQLENQTDMDQNESEDDSYLQQLEHFKRHPLNLNEADAGELRDLHFLTDLQIDNLISYRDLLGKFISIYELQAIPTWDVASIKKILPYVKVSDAESLSADIRNRLTRGDNRLLLRYARLIEKSKGFDDTTEAKKYLGSQARIFFRYRYQYKDLLQYGLVGDKDAGEQFLKGSQKFGFDFYSFHLFARRLGNIKALALGDFTVNMGQGLIQWQSLAFKKNSDVVEIKRQSAILHPYNSSGEFYFHRGAGATIQLGRVQATGYASLRKLSANVVIDTTDNEQFISSFLTSGYHRNENENGNRNNLHQLSFGANISYIAKNWHVGINGVSYNFSLPVQKRAEPYNLFSINGTRWGNFSVDYSYTVRNVHFFGEAAADKNLRTAFVNGLLISVDPAVDLSILHRAINKAYQAVNGNAFTENSNPINEQGLYFGVCLRPLASWRLDMYADFYAFPWLKYLVDAPSFGRDFLLQFTYSPSRQLEIFSRYRNESKQSNQPDNQTVANYLVFIPKQSWRTQLNYKLDASVTVRNRVELLWYNKPPASLTSGTSVTGETGFLMYFDLIYKPALRPCSGNIRLQYFETSGYDSRIYAYENDVLYSFSIPGSFDKGYRYYVNLSCNLKKNIAFWMRWAQTVYPDKDNIGSGSDQIKGNHRSEIKLQLQWLF